MTAYAGEGLSRTAPVRTAPVRTGAARRARARTAVTRTGAAASAVLRPASCTASGTAQARAGRHRTGLARTGAVLAGLAAPLLCLAPARAAAPRERPQVVAAPSAAPAPGPKTGWWNTATVMGTALPATTAPDDLHVQAEPTGTLAFAAMSYTVAPFSSATLTLAIAPSSLVGTPVVQLCPTTDDAWKAGGDQPADAAPKTACPGRSVPGVVGTDAAGGTTLTFLLDAAQQASPGLLTVAVAPVDGTTAPFSFDLAAPGAAALVVQPVLTSAPTSAPDAGTAAAPPAADGGGAALQPGSTLPVGPVDSGTAPLPGPALAPGVQAPSDPSVAAAPAPVTAPLASGPQQLRRSALRAPLPDETRVRTAAVVGLLVLAAGLAYQVGNRREEPLRLLGGRALRTTGAGAATGPARGIGRFAKPRAALPRRLL